MRAQNAVVSGLLSTRASTGCSPLAAASAKTSSSACASSGRVPAAALAGSSPGGHRVLGPRLGNRAPRLAPGLALYGGLKALLGAGVIGLEDHAFRIMR
ncbi:hypothetical protein AB0K18_05315 [Nonomuraea sp. NPDC049421]|uniref:hypothetical protein n=1 Tax=Nonomuraea sp. NPDC049421 TaxID=3155275 RepID=UPI0034457635